MLRRLAALACLLALLAPAAATAASSAPCVDACCDDGCAAPDDGCATPDDGCATPDAGSPSDDDRGCPEGCPECACCARRPATPVEAPSLLPALTLTALPTLEPSSRPADADPREILHVPLA